MAGLKIPIGLDTTGFDKQLQQLQSNIAKLGKEMEQKGSIGLNAEKELVGKSYISAAEESAKKLTDEAGKYVSKLSDANTLMRAIEGSAGSLDLKTKSGREELGKMFQHWSGVREKIGEASVSFEQLYQIQREYTRLTGKKFDIGSYTDMQKLHEEVDALRKAEKKYQEEYKQLVRETELEDKRVAREKQARDKQLANERIDAARREQDFYDQLERNRINARKAESKAAWEEHFKQQDALEKKTASEIADPAIQMKASTVAEYQKKIEALTEAQKKLDTSTQAGAKKYEELGKEIRKSENAITKLRQEKEKLSKVSNELGKKLATVFSIAAIQNFVKNVVTIGGELQKQRIALGGIINDMSKANILFSQLRMQSRESPFQFKQLIDTTRLLAAYSIKKDELYEAQFMVSELSAGLGVSVDRLILAYGQVKAAAVLRGQELRQFTEAGVPIIDALAKKFTELEGRVVSTGEVFEKVSNRLVPFKMVHEVLKEMTEEGGKFYQMQAMQAQTVAGQYAKIGDALQIMYHQIAESNTGLLIGGMKMLRAMIDGWKGVATAVGIAGSAMAVYKAYTTAVALNSIKAGTAMVDLTQKQIAAQRTLNAIQNVGIGLAIAGLTLLIGKLIDYATESSRFKKQISQISSAAADEYSNEVGKMKSLIDTMSKATAGSHEYNEAKDKLRSQFQQYIPFVINEKTSVDELTAAYDGATAAMKAYHAERALAEAMQEMNEDSAVKRARNNMANILKTGLIATGDFSKKEAEVFSRGIIPDIEEAIKNGKALSDVIELIRKRATLLGKDIDSIPFDRIFNPEGQAHQGKMQYVAENIGFVFDEFSKVIKDKVSTIVGINKTQFGTLYQSIDDATNSLNELYKEQASKIKSDSSALNQELEMEILNRNKMIMEAAKQPFTQLALSFKAVTGRVLSNTENGFMIDALKSFLYGDTGEAKRKIELITDEMNKALKEQGKSVTYTFEKIYADIIGAVSGEGDSLQTIFRDFYESQEEGLKRMAANSGKTGDELNRFIAAQEKGILTLKGFTGNFKSMKDVLAIDDEIKALKENIIQGVVALELLKKSSSFDQDAGFKIWSFTGKDDAVKQHEDNLVALNTQLTAAEALRKIFDKIFTTKSGGGGKGEDPQIAQARKLVQIMKEVNKAYEAYNENLGIEQSELNTLNEFKEQYNELNKEMGGKLPQLEVIKSQSELVDKLQGFLDSGVVSSKKAQNVLTTAIISASGGQEVEQAKKHLDKLKKDVEDTLGNIVFGVNEEESFKAIDDLMQQIKTLKDAGATKAGDIYIDLDVKISEKTKESAFHAIERALNEAKQNFENTETIKSLEASLGIIVPDFLKQNLTTYREYIDSLIKARDEYSKHGDKGAEEAAKLDKQINQERFQYIAGNMERIVALEWKLADTQEKIAIKNRERLKLQEEQTDAVAEAHKRLLAAGLQVSKEDVQKMLEESPLTIADDLQGKFENVGFSQGLITELTEVGTKFREIALSIVDVNKEMGTMKEGLYEETNLFKMLAGEIADYGSQVQEQYLKSLQSAMANKTTDDAKGTVSFLFGGETITRTTKEFEKMSSKVNNDLRKIGDDNTLKKIGKGFKNMWGEIKGEDGETIAKGFNFEGVGQSISLIGGELSKLSNLGGLGKMIGADEHTQGLIGNIAGGVGAMGKIVASKGMDIGAWIELANAVISISDSGKEKQIQFHQKTIEKMQKDYEKVAALADKASNFEKLNKDFQEAMDLLVEIEELNKKSAQLEKDKKATDKDTVKKYEDAAEEARKQQEELRDKFIAEYSFNLKDTAQQFADAWLSAFEETGDGMKGFEDSIEDMLRNVAKKQVAMKFMDKILAPLKQVMDEVIDPKGDGSFEIMKDEWTRLLGAMGKASDDMRVMSPILEEFFTTLGIGAGGADKLDSLQKGIQGITENTAGVIASYMNAIRIDVVMIRQILEGSYGVQRVGQDNDSTRLIFNLMTVYYPQYLENMIAIRENTMYLQRAYDPSRQGFRVS